MSAIDGNPDIHRRCAEGPRLTHCGSWHPSPSLSQKEASRRSEPRREYRPSDVLQFMCGQSFEGRRSVMRGQSPSLRPWLTGELENHSALGRFCLNELPTQIYIVTRIAIAAWQNRHAVSHKLPPP